MTLSKPVQTNIFKYYSAFCSMDYKPSNQGFTENHWKCVCVIKWSVKQVCKRTVFSELHSNFFLKKEREKKKEMRKNALIGFGTAAGFLIVLLPEMTQT